MVSPVAGTSVSTVLANTYATASMAWMLNRSVTSLPLALSVTVIWFSSSSRYSSSQSSTMPSRHTL